MGDGQAGARDLVLAEVERARALWLDEDEARRVRSVDAVIAKFDDEGLFSELFRVFPIVAFA